MAHGETEKERMVKIVRIAVATLVVVIFDLSAIPANKFCCNGNGIAKGELRFERLADSAMSRQNANTSRNNRDTAFSFSDARIVWSVVDGQRSVALSALLAWI